MKNFPTLSVFSVSMLLIFSSLGFSQSSDFAYKEKGRSQYSATLYFSNENGNEEVSPDIFQEDEMIYFSIKPNASSEREYFKDTDASDLFAPVKILQFGNLISQSAAPNEIRNADDKIDRIVLSYSKADLRLYESFELINAIDSTEALLLDDKYYSQYSKYRPIYDEAMDLSDNLEYMQTFQKLMQIAEDAKSNEEIKHYRFYEHATNTLMGNAIRQYADSLSRLIEIKYADIQTKFTNTDLQELDSIYKDLQAGMRTFDPYFEMDIAASDTTKKTYQSLLDQSTELRSQCFVLYKNNVLSFLKTNKYNKYKFRLFIDVLAKMITQLDTLRNVEGLDTLRMTSLDKLKNEKEELINIGWVGDFKTLIEMLNMDILAKGKVFDDSIMANLQQFKSAEHQPYLLIFSAFNELSSNKSNFKNYLKNAIIYCTDEDLIDNMEMWILSYDLTDEDFPASMVHKVNKGIVLIEQEKWGDASSTFSTITKQANTIAPPWFYLGQAQYHEGEIFLAESKFDKALEIYPEYMAPRLFTFNMLYDQERYDDLLGNIEEALAVNDNWFFHFWKAKTLYALEKYDGCILELNANCINLNPYDIDEQFLLGDAYVASNQYSLAEEAYRKTQDIDSYKSEKVYSQKMISLQDLKK